MLDKPPAISTGSIVNDRFEQTFVDIATEISRLNKITNTIRRASKETQLLKTIGFQMKGDDDNDVEPVLLGHFEHHIRDQFPDISEAIGKRLSHAMLLRRKQILYGRHRQGNTAIQPQRAAPRVSMALPATQPTEPRTQSNSKQISAVAATAITCSQSQVKSATTLTPGAFKRASLSPSIISASKTVALGNHEALVFPPAPGAASKRKYEQLRDRRIADSHDAIVKGEATLDTESKLDKVLKSDLQAIGEVTCPYCAYALPAEEVFGESKWQ